MRNKTTTNVIRPIQLNFIGTPITDETFENQGWTKIDAQDSLFDDESDEYEEDFDDFDEFPEDYDKLREEHDKNDTFFPIENPLDEYGIGFDQFSFDMDAKYPNLGDWEENYYFWVLKIPRFWPTDDCLTLISTTNDHHLPGFEKGEYIVELYNENGIGTCQSEEQIEILYRALTGESIYK